MSAVKALQSDALLLNQSSVVIDEVLESLGGFTWPGVSTDVGKLKRLKDTLLNVSKSIERNVVVLSPIPAMGYTYSRKQAEERRTVSPDPVEAHNNNTNKHQL